MQSLCKTCHQVLGSTAAPSSIQLGGHEEADLGVTYVFFSDIEGKYDLFLQYVQKWRELGMFKPGVGDEELELNDGHGLVFGGDSQDDGVGDIRFVQVLLQLKRKYPRRVFLIIGNRDANKLRFYNELQEYVLKGETYQNDQNFPYWEKVQNSFADWLKENTTEDIFVDRVKWMLAKTMGAGQAFENRRRELGILKRDQKDRAVAQSFYDEIDVNSKENFMWQYLSNANIMKHIGNVIFVHGGITTDTFGYTPGVVAEKKYTMLGPWLQNIHKFRDSQLHNFARAQTLSPEQLKNQVNPHNANEMKAGQPLMRYASKNTFAKHSAMVANYIHSDDAASPENVNTVVWKSNVWDPLYKDGIAFVISGHKPRGGGPTVIHGPLRKNKSNVMFRHFVIACDVSKVRNAISFVQIKPISDIQNAKIIPSPTTYMSLGQKIMSNMIVPNTPIGKVIQRKDGKWYIFAMDNQSKTVNIVKISDKQRVVETEQVVMPQLFMNLSRFTPTST